MYFNACVGGWEGWAARNRDNYVIPLRHGHHVRLVTGKTSSHETPLMVCNADIKLLCVSVFVCVQLYFDFKAGVALLPFSKPVELGNMFGCHLFHIRSEKCIYLFLTSVVTCNVALKYLRGDSWTADKT